MRRAAAPSIVWVLAAVAAAGQQPEPQHPAGGPPAAALAAFKAHIRYTESGLDSLLQDGNAFLWAKSEAQRARLQKGSVICEPRIGKGERAVKSGLIHDWVGAVFVPGASVGRVLKLIQEYDNHKNAYPSNVIDSKIISRKGNDLTVYLRLLERKGGITVVLDTDYEVEYRPLGNGDWRSRSYSTRIQEVENAGRRNERRKPAGEGRGYLWALNTYWLFRERDGGAYVECEAVSLSRGLPPILSFMARSIVRGLPRGFLQNTLEDTRDLVLGKPPRVRR